jgi:hypothetical protein
MSEIEALIRIVLGAAMVDGEVDQRETQRLKQVARSVSADAVLKSVLSDLVDTQAKLVDVASVLSWVTPAARVLAQGGDQTKFVAAYAIDRVVADDGALKQSEIEYRDGILALIQAGNRS